MHTYSLGDGEHFPAARVDGDESRGQQLSVLRCVIFRDIKHLIDADLNGKRKKKIVWIKINSYFRLAIRSVLLLIVCLHF